jgi:hypothetical protein
MTAYTTLYSAVVAIIPNASDRTAIDVVPAFLAR